MKKKESNLEVEQATLRFSNELKDYVAIAEKLKVESEEDYQRATEELLKIKQAEKRAEEEKNKVLKPLNEAVKAERARWKPIEVVFEKINSIIRPKMVAFMNAKEAKAKADLAKLQQKIESGKIKGEGTIARREEQILSNLPSPTVHTGSGSSSMRKVAKLKIVNPDLIPDEYWVIDEVKLRADVVTKDKVVPGAEKVYENSIAII